MNKQIFLFLLLSSFSSLLWSQATGLNAYESSYLYLNTYPDNGTPNWGDDDWLTNGIAHDDSNWYICSLRAGLFGEPDDDWAIFRIPVAESLDQDFSGNPSVITKQLIEIPTLNDLKYYHAGDIDCFRRNGIDYLFVPLTSSIAQPAIAILGADDLSFINYAILLGPSGNGQNDIGWCAINPIDNCLYTSDDDATAFYQYSINWSIILNEPNNHNGLTFVNSHPHNVFGGVLHDMQGGEFTPSGEQLYVSCGVFGCAFTPCENTDGIHVFNTNTWEVVQGSYNEVNSIATTPPHFIYSFENSAAGGDEPEGLTIWDLDEVANAPENVKGQLHVILYIHNYFQSNKVKLKHYSKNIYVDLSATPPPTQFPPITYPLPGTALRPFNTVNNAYNFYSTIWDGAQMVIKAGTYPDIGTYSKRIRITSSGGTAVIGQ